MSSLQLVLERWVMRSGDLSTLLSHLRSMCYLDTKTGLLTGLLTGIQGWKCPVALSQTCYGSKSLKVILMDSNFGGHPVLNLLVTLWCSRLLVEFFFRSKVLFLKGGNRSWRASQMEEHCVTTRQTVRFEFLVHEGNVTLPSWVMIRTLWP